MSENNFGNTGGGIPDYGTTGGGTSEFGATSGTGSMAGGSSMAGGVTETCPHCGQAMSKGGVEEMLAKLKSQFQNVDIDEYMNTAREYLKTGSTKATTFAKENPAKIAAGAAAIALGAGLLYAAMHRDKGHTIEITRNEGEMPPGPKSAL